MIEIFYNGRGYDIEQKHFPDGTLNLNGNAFPAHINTIHWHYENDSELFTLICLRMKYENDDVELVMPYIPHARMDRVKDDDDVFTLKYFAKTINSLKFSKVSVFDPHSNVALALIDNIKVYWPEHHIFDVTHHIAFLEENDVSHQAYEKSMDDLTFFYPDEGAMKRYSSIFHHNYAFGIKKRDWKTGQIQGLSIVNEDLVKGKNILIVDDICSKGGTFYHSAKALKDAGAKNIYLYISHCENSVFEGDMYKSDLIKKIFTVHPLFDKHINDKKIAIIE